MADRPKPLSSWGIIALGLIYAAGILLAGIVVGTNLGGQTPKFLAYAPHNLSDQELTHTGEFQLKPNTIILNFISPTQLRRECHDQYALACTKTWERPCEIYLPVDNSISYWPDQQTAIWSDFHVNEVLAHEILHCYAPNWHRPWTLKFEKWLTRNYKYDGQ